MVPASCTPGPVQCCVLCGHCALTCVLCSASCHAHSLQAKKPVSLENSVLTRLPLLPNTLRLQQADQNRWPIKVRAVWCYNLVVMQCTLPVLHNVWAVQFGVTRSNRTGIVHSSGCLCQINARKLEPSRMLRHSKWKSLAISWRMLCTIKPHHPNLLVSMCSLWLARDALRSFTCCHCLLPWLRKFRCVCRTCAFTGHARGY